MMEVIHGQSRKARSVVAQFQSIPTKSAIVQAEEASPASIAGLL